MLADFLRTQCASSPAARVKLRDLMSAFHAALPPDERPKWNRGRVLAELAQLGIQFGTDTSHVTWVAGVGIDVAWKVQDGQIIRSA